METQRSKYLLKRKSLLQGKMLPTISRLKQILGKNVSSVFVEQLSPSARNLLGVEPLLKGVSGDLWTSPSDLLIGKVCLKPPLTTKHMKALTHKGILQIGREIEMKFWNQMEFEKEHAIKLQEHNMQAQFDVELRTIGVSVQKEERQKCGKEMKKLEKQFEENLKTELQKLEVRLNDTSHITAQLTKQKEILDVKWQQRLDEEIEKTVKRLTNKCLQELKKQEMLLLQHFELNLKEAEISKQRAINEEHTHCKDAIRQLRHQLECKNIANMMYILCMERRKCQKERDFILCSYTKHVNELNRSIEQRDEEIEKLATQLSEKEQTLQLREECLSRILRQYQKFINYALKATPTQAEFLLNIEKLMMYELTDTLVNKKPVDEEKWLIGCPKIFQWNVHKEKPVTPQPSQDGISIHDHHNCFEEADLPRELRPETDQLPMFYYNNRMYVREDFRNRFSHEIKMSPSNKIWNEDVESLMNILRQSVHQEESVTSKGKSPTKRSSIVRDSSNARVSFTKLSPGKETDIISMSSSTLHKHSARRKSSIRYPIDADGLVDLEAVGQEEEKKTLLGTRNSLELIRRSLSPLVIEESVLEALGTVLPSVEVIEGEKVDLKQAEDVRKTLTDQINEANEKQKIKANETYSHSTTDPSVNQMYFKSTENTSLMEPEFMTESQAQDKDHHPSSNISRKVSKLVFTRDSLILKKEQSLQNQLDDIMEAKVVVLKDSLTLVTLSTEKPESLTNVEKPRSCLKLSIDAGQIAPISEEPTVLLTSESKLSHARDSVQMLRESKKNLHDVKTDQPCKHSIPENAESEELIQSLYAEEEKSQVVYFDKRTSVCDFAVKSLPKMYSAIAKPVPQKRSRDNFLKKKNGLKIVGDTEAIEQQTQRQTADEFTASRITSLINLIKDNPDLIGMFTSFSR